MVPHDVTCENKRCALDMACLKCINTKLPKMAAKPKAGTTQIAGWSARCHTLPRIFWACPNDRSLQPLYLHYITMLCLVITNLHIYRNEDGVALPHHWLRVPPPPTMLLERNCHLSSSTRVCEFQHHGLTMHHNITE